MVARADCPHSAAGTPLFQQCWVAATKSQIHPFESWEKPQGRPAVILIKHMLPRGKTQHSFVKEEPNPALCCRDCQARCWCPGVQLEEATRVLLVPVALTAWSLASPRQQVKIPKESQTWTSQQIKWNATESQLWCKTSFCRTKRSFHNLVLRNSITYR